MRSAPAGRPGQGPDGRRHAPIRSAVEALVAVWRQWNAVDGSRLAAALAFYSMLSLAPFLILLVAVGSWWLGTDTTTHYLTSRIAELMGPDAARLVDRLAASHDVPPAFHRWGASVGTVITRRRCHGRLRRAAACAQPDIRRSAPPPMLVLVRARALSFCLVVGTGILLIASFALSLGIAMFVNHETTILAGAVITSVRMTTRRDAHLARAESGDKKGANASIRPMEPEGGSARGPGLSPGGDRGDTVNADAP